MVSSWRSGLGAGAVERLNPSHAREIEVIGEDSSVAAERVGSGVGRDRLSLVRAALARIEGRGEAGDGGREGAPFAGTGVTLPRAPIISSPVPAVTVKEYRPSGAPPAARLQVQAPTNPGAPPPSPEVKNRRTPAPPKLRARPRRSIRPSLFSVSRFYPRFPVRHSSAFQIEPQPFRRRNPSDREPTTLRVDQAHMRAAPAVVLAGRGSRSGSRSRSCFETGQGSAKEGPDAGAPGV